MLRLSVPNIGDEEITAAEAVLRTGFLVHGKECDLFENELAAYIGVKEVVVVTSGTAALHLSLLALGVGEGDAVLVPDFTWPATVNVVEIMRATPVFVDVDPRIYNITSQTVSKALHDWSGPGKIKAIMPVHEFGCPADMTEIMAIANEHDLLVVEDAACALGAVHKGKMVGSFGNTGCFSFHPRKSITTGEGGAICTNDRALAEKLRLLRSHGISRTEKGIAFSLAGLNYRMTNFQGAMGRVQLRKFPTWLEQRRELKKTYDELLEGVNDILIPENVHGHSWQTYMVTLDQKYDRQQVIAKLREEGIETNMGAQSVISQEYYEQYQADYPEIVHSKNLYNQGLALPFCETYSPEDLKEAVQKLKETLDDLAINFL